MAERAAATVLAEENGEPLPPGFDAGPPALGPELGDVAMEVAGALDLVATTLIANF